MKSPDSLDSAADAIVEVVATQGLCILPGILPRSTALDLRSHVDAFHRREAGADGDRLAHRRVLALAVKHPAFIDLMCHPLAMAVCVRLLGPDFFCSTWSANVLLPGFDRIYWHVDHPYWTIAAPYPVEPPLTAHMIWCLDDFSAESGSTMFVPRSHRRSHLPHHEQDCGHEAVSVDAPAGSLIVAHGAIWHAPGHNRTDRTRSAVFGRYARSYIVPQEDLRHQLQEINTQDELVRRLMGERQYVPQRGLPY